MQINRNDTSLRDQMRTSEYSPITQSPKSEEISNKAEGNKTFTQEQQDKFEEQIKKLNESIASSGKELKFKYNEDAKQLYVEVLDAKTKEVVTSLPPEFLIDLSLKMKEMIGVFLDKRI